jgi:predicted kinase
MTQLKIILTKGLPAAGKDTWASLTLAQDKTFKRVNKDDLRLMLDNGKFSSGNEKFILQARDCLIDAILSAGFNVLVTDTNLHPSHEVNIRKKFGHRATIEVKMFQVPLEECIRRDNERNVGKVGEKVIRDMHERYGDP